MPVSEILEIPVLSESMAQKTIAVNMALLAMEQAIAGKLVVQTDDATTSGYDLIIPFDDTNDLTGREALRAIFYELVAGATAAFDLWHPANPHLFVIKNGTAYTVTVKVTGTGGASVSVPASSTYLLYCDGTNMVKMDFTLNNLTQAYDHHIAFWGMPDDAQVMARFLIARDTIFAANFAGSIGKVAVAPVFSRTFTVKDDAVTIGTITVDDAGDVSFATSGGSAKTVERGSVLTIVNQAGAPDTLMTDIELVLAATIIVAQPVP